MFRGTLFGCGLKADVGVRRLIITSNGGIRRFGPESNQISYNITLDQKGGQVTMFITECAVLRKTPDGINVNELAPGVCLQEAMLDQKVFEPRIALLTDLKEMDVYSVTALGPT